MPYDPRQADLYIFKRHQRGEYKTPFEVMWPNSPEQTTRELTSAIRSLDHLLSEQRWQYVVVSVSRPENSPGDVLPTVQSVSENYGAAEDEATIVGKRLDDALNILGNAGREIA